MFHRSGSLIGLLLFVACGSPPPETAKTGTTGAAGIPARIGGLEEGKDFLVFERVRILDEMGFDQPVEAMSVLVPKGWRTESNVTWGSLSGCRGDIVTWQMKSTSPDSGIEFVVFPTRTFVASQHQATHQALMAAAQQGGCAVTPPFTAREYVEGFAFNELGANKVSQVQDDQVLRTLLDKVAAQSNAVSTQNGTGMKQTGSAVFGTATWPDGKQGLINVGVSVLETPGVDANGARSGFASTSVFHRIYVKYLPEREAEALKYFRTITSSHRMNPVWQKAKEQFLAQLGNAEHAGRMERLRLLGEHAKAYAKSANEASEARMRDWEKKQASSDANQSRTIQSIREVETWKDASGSPVELNAGYEYGWSRPDGSIILTNTSTFNPAVALRQNWERMEKVKR